MEISNSYARPADLRSCGVGSNPALSTKRDVGLSQRPSITANARRASSFAPWSLGCWGTKASPTGYSGGVAGGWAFSAVAYRCMVGFLRRAGLANSPLVKGKRAEPQARGSGLALLFSAVPIPLYAGIAVSRPEFDDRGEGSPRLAIPP